MLHSLLHVIITKLKLSSVNVEFRGTDSERLQSYIASSARPSHCVLTLTEYTIQAQDSKDSKESREERSKGTKASTVTKGMQKKCSKVII